jgi:hypothetical protein
MIRYVGGVKCVPFSVIESDETCDEERVEA